MNRSKALMATAPSFSVRLQLASHGWGQMRPMVAGNGFTAARRSHARA